MKNSHTCAFLLLVLNFNNIDIILFHFPDKGITGDPEHIRCCFLVVFAAYQRILQHLDLKVLKIMRTGPVMGYLCFSGTDRKVIYTEFISFAEDEGTFYSPTLSC